MKNQFFADKRDLFKYDLWLEIANALQIRKHTFIPMLTPNDSTKQGGRFPGDAGNYRQSIFEFLKSCRNRRNIKQLRGFFRGQSLEYHPYKDTERGYFKHDSRDKYFVGIPPDWLRDAAILIDPDVGLETKGRFWKKRPDQYVRFNEVANLVRAASGKSVILLFQFLRPNANNREADLRKKEQLLRGELEAVRCGWRPIPWVAERQKSRDGRALPRELAFFIIAVGKKTEEAVETVVRDYARSRGLLPWLGCGEVPMDLQYPIGKFQWQENLTDEQRRSMIEQIAELPGKVRAAVAGLSEQQFDTPYREGGWTVRQVIHHLADSHLNAFVRFKLALTEDRPTVKTYEQQLWAELADARTAPVEPSLAMLEGLHQRWVIMLRQMSAADFARQFQHPEHGVMKLERLLGMYAWHGRHHLAHITSLCERMEWNRVYIGDFKNDAAEWIRPGWFVGQFFPRRPRQTDKVEFKYWEYPEGAVNHAEKTSATLECTLILKGEITGLIDGKMESLHAGQYVVISPGVPNGFPKTVQKKVVGLTIKAPSDPSAKKLTGRD